MNRPLWHRDEVDSPCINVCVIHPETRLCLGCHRTAGEIARWSSMTPDERQATLAALPDRQAAPNRRRGGAAGRRSRLSENDREG